MVKDNLIKKGLAIAIIFLFIGLAIAPSINANNSKDMEMVKITTEVCGLNGGKHTVQLTKEEVIELKLLIDDIEKRFDEVKTSRETVEIFKEVVLELDKYDLIPHRFNFDEEIQLMMKCIPNSKFPLEIFNKSNFFNLIFGRGDKMVIMTHINLILMIIYYNLLHNDKLPLLQSFLLLVANRKRMRLFGGGLHFSGNSSAITIGLKGIQKFERNDLIIMLIGFVGLIFTSPIINFAIGFNLMSFTSRLAIT